MSRPARARRSAGGRDARRSRCPRGRTAAPLPARRVPEARAGRSRGRAASAAAPASAPARAPGPTIMDAVKVGIVVPYSWSFWGAVVEHAELQADALRGLGCEVKTIMGNDPPGQFTRVLHP